MKKLLWLLAVSPFFVSCSNDDSSEAQPTVNSVFYGYTNHSLFILLDPQGENLYHFEYQNGKVTKRIGGMVYLTPASGFEGIFRDFVYDEVSHDGNFISIVRKLEPQYGQFAGNLQKYKLNSSGKPIWQTNWREFYEPSPMDTIHYEYDASGKIKKTTKGDFSHCFVSEYYFNAQSDLDSVVTQEMYSGEVMLERDVEIFENYDNTPNPLKKLWMFTDLRYRALSTHNFQTYSYKQYFDGELMYTNSYDFNIPHVDGQIRYDIGW